MIDTFKDRRRLSHTGLLDATIRTLSILALSGDMRNRALANQALANLLQLRRQMPARRQYDMSARKS